MIFGSAVCSKRAPPLQVQTPCDIMALSDAHVHHSGRNFTEIADFHPESKKLSSGDCVRYEFSFIEVVLPWPDAPHCLLNSLHFQLGHVLQRRSADSPFARALCETRAVLCHAAVEQFESFAWLADFVECFQ